MRAHEEELKKQYASTQKKKPATSILPGRPLPLR